MRTLPPIVVFWFRAAVLVLALGTHAEALQVTGYSSAENDRFSSGFPGAPVNNEATNFVGTSFDWSGVAWASNNPTKGFGLLSPRHFLVASHYGGATGLQGFTAGAALTTGVQQSVTNIGHGLSFGGVLDLSVGTLTTPGFVPPGLARYAVLDLNESSTVDTPANYEGFPVFLYGRGPDGTFSPRIGATTIALVVSSGTNQYFATLRTQVQLESGDSGSPSFHGWTNPNGGLELTMLGNNAGTNATYNGLNFLGAAPVMNALNTAMTPTGYALRVAGNPSNTWVGADTTTIGSSNAWGPGSPALAPSDTYVLFDAANASNRAVNVAAAHNLRGLYFKSGAGTNDGFTFSGAGTLTVGRGGVVNYDADRQVFNAALRLGDHQYWDGGSGGVTLSNLDSNGKLLEMAGTGTNRIIGAVSGAGSLAVSGARLELTASNSYAGATWVHSGTLELASTAGSAAGATASLTVAAGATLLISRSDQVNDGATVTLSGGTITRGDGVAEVFGNLNLTTASFLDYGLGAAGTLRFGTYSPVSLLTVINFSLGNKLQFGNVISEGDLATKFSFSNLYTTGTEGGFFTITAIPETSTLTAILLLCAMGVINIVARARQSLGWRLIQRFFVS
jgi:autotransporter-associated beta strand protein